MKSKVRFCYLGNEGIIPFLGILIVFILLGLEEKIFDFSYVDHTTAVQNGDYSSWHSYLLYGFLTVFLGFLSTIWKVYASLWLEKTQKLHFFAHFDGLLQTGRKRVCLKKFELENAKLNTIICTIYTIIIIIYTFCLMSYRELFGKMEIISVGCILTLGFLFGVIRGRLQYETDNIRAEIQTRQELLSNHFLISSNILEEHLKRIEKCFIRQRRLQIIKNGFQFCGDTLKMMVFLISMWNLVGQTENPYSYSYAILLVYGYIIKIASGMSEIVENIGKIIKLSKDQEIKSLIEYDKQRENTIISQAKNVILNNSGLTICPGFTANVSHTDRADSYYQVPNPISIRVGEIIRLSGENQTGKSRFNRLLKELFPESTIMYEANTSISRILSENFVSESIPLDYALIRRLAEKVKIEDRFPNSEKSFMKLEFNDDLNSASFQLVLIVQILYFAIKESEVNPSKPQLIIFDEILSNIAQESIENVLDVIKTELSRTNACCIMVSHSHSEIISKYIKKTWRMTNNGTKIVLEEI